MASPRSRAAELARDTAVGLLECVEDALLLGGRDADAGVGDRKFERGRSGPRGDRGHGQQHGARVGELDRVVHQVAEHLAQANGIAMHGGRHPARNVCGDFDALVVGARAEQANHLLELAPQFEGAGGQRELAGFGLGEVEHVVDERDERFGR